LVTQLRIGDLGIPRELPGPRIDCHDVRIARCREKLVAVNGDVPLNAAAIAGGSVTLSEARNGALFSATRCRRRRRPRYLRTVLPDQITSGGIQRLNDAAGIRQVHDAVVYERR